MEVKQRNAIWLTRKMEAYLLSYLFVTGTTLYIFRGEKPSQTFCLWRENPKELIGCVRRGPWQCERGGESGYLGTTAVLVGGGQWCGTPYTCGGGCWHCIRIRQLCCHCKDVSVWHSGKYIWTSLCMGLLGGGLVGSKLRLHFFLDFFVEVLF